MRTFVTVVAGALVIVASAFANNIATTQLATASSGSASVVYGGVTYGPNYALSPYGGAWIAAGGSVNPYLLITLNTPATVYSVTVNGGGNSGMFSAFDVFVGSALPNLANFSTLSQTALIAQLEGTGSNMSLIGTETDQLDGYAWADSFAVSPSAPIQYMLYLGISGGTNIPACSGTCEPGIVTAGIGQDDAFTTGIAISTTPEPATFGMFGAAMLLIGFARRSRK